MGLPERLDPCVDLPGVKDIMEATDVLSSTYIHGTGDSELNKKCSLRAAFLILSH
jgi:hypothetical protein